KVIRDRLGVERGGEVFLFVGENRHGPFDVERVPLSTLRLLRFHQEEDQFIFVPQSLDLADGSEVRVAVVELEADDLPPPALPVASEADEFGDEGESDEDDDGVIDLNDESAGAADNELGDGVAERALETGGGTPTKVRKADVIAEIVTGMPKNF